MNIREIVATLGLGVLLAFLLHPVRHVEDVRQGFAENFDPGNRPAAADPPHDRSGHEPEHP